jgi:glucuronoarabinoxylan endo-1,4-beta-xylanase
MTFARRAVVTLAGVSLALVAAGCGSSGGGATSGTGGATATGGASGPGSGGTGGTGTGGASGTGGSKATGGSGGGAGSGNTGGAGATGGSSGGKGGGGSSLGGQAGSGSGATGGAGGQGGGGNGSGGAGTGGAAGISGGTGGAVTACGAGTATSSDMVVNLGQNEQPMDGFGVSNAYQSTALTDAQADQFFDPNKGIGLSIFRLGIQSDGTSLGPIGDAVKAAARGAIVWAAPWTPPANCKSNGSVDNGGSLNTSNNCYDSWASTLAAFPAMAKASGVTVMGISAQNESDNTTPYESCVYTAAQMVSFIKVLGPKLKALNPPVKLLSPESTRWDHLWGTDYDYGDAILADATAAAAVDILATHMYETEVAVAPPAGVTKPIWMTEMSGVMGYPNAGPSSDISNGLVVAGWIHDAITVGYARSWHAWWITSLNADNEGLLLMGGGTTKRLYTLGNYSKFIRPGYQRVAVSGTIPSALMVTAYTNPTDGTVVVVAINNGSSDVSVPIFLSGGAPCSMTPWVTSASDNLASKTAVAVTAGRFTPTLAASTVTTFVGKP